MSTLFFILLLNGCAGDNTIEPNITSEEEVIYNNQSVAPPILNNNAYLMSISISVGELKPLFHRLTTNYSVVVDSLVTEITINALIADSKATLINSAVRLENLKDGDVHQISFPVTAEDGVTKKEYQVTVIKEGISTNANLEKISTTSGTLTPVFSPETTNYTLSLPFDITQVSLTATKEHPQSTLSIESITMSNFEMGISQIAQWTVTAANNTTLKKYTVVVTANPVQNFLVSPSLFNGSFEYWNSGMPTGWIYQNSTGTAPTIQVETTSIKQGTSALKMTYTDGYGFIQRTGTLVAVSPNTLYTISAWIKKDNVVYVKNPGIEGQEFRIRIDYRKADQLGRIGTFMDLFPSVPSTTEWEKVSISFTTPSDCEYIQIQPMGGAWKSGGNSTVSGTVWIDDILIWK